jgi:hypothetical protein
MGRRGKSGVDEIAASVVSFLLWVMEHWSTGKQRLRMPSMEGIRVAYFQATGRNFCIDNHCYPYCGLIGWVELDMPLLQVIMLYSTLFLLTFLTRMYSWSYCLWLYSCDCDCDCDYAGSNQHFFVETACLSIISFCIIISCDYPHRPYERRLKCRSLVPTVRYLTFQ